MICMGSGGGGRGGLRTDAGIGSRNPFHSYRLILKGPPPRYWKLQKWVQRPNLPPTQLVKIPNHSHAGQGMDSVSGECLGLPLKSSPFLSCQLGAANPSVPLCPSVVFRAGHVFIPLLVPSPMLLDSPAPTESHGGILGTS